MDQKREPPALATRAARETVHVGTLNAPRDNQPDATAQAPVTVAEWPKGRDTIRVRLDSFNGHQTIDVRAWWIDKAGDLRPGRSGITLGIRHLPRLVDALGQALAEATARGLLHDDEGGGP